MKSFYFANADRALRYGDGRKIKVGVTHKHEGEVILCKSGLHASLSPFEALYYAPGPILYLVHLSGTIVRGADKVAASERTYLAEYDATDLLRLFARKCALKNIELISPYCSSEQYALIVNYLTAGDVSMRSAAESAAERAADAAESAAWSAAEKALAEEFNAMVKEATGWGF